jgi:hypothetical protein
MNIHFLPAYGIEAASSRLRCFFIADALRELGRQATVGENLPSDIEVLIIQKKVDENVLQKARTTRSQGARLVFDIDDWGEAALPWRSEQNNILRELLSLCDAITVDTAKRQSFLKSEWEFLKIPIWVVPDTIDYSYTRYGCLAEARKADPSGPIKGCWFGNAPNIIPALPIIELVQKSEHVEKFSIYSNIEFGPSLSQHLPRCEVIPWNLNTFPRLLAMNDFCVLFHGSGSVDAQKSNNKMLAALWQGVVPFVSNSEAYRATAEAIGCPDLIIENEERFVSKLSAEFIEYILGKLQQPHVTEFLNELAPQKVAMRLEALLAGEM